MNVRKLVRTWTQEEADRLERLHDREVDPEELEAALAERVEWELASMHPLVRTLVRVWVRTG